MKARIVALVQQLVRTDSVAIPPDGHEGPAQKVLLRFCKEHNLDAELYDTGFVLRSNHPYVRRDRHYRGRPNLIARLPGTGRGRSLLLTGHVDTVPAGTGAWHDSPFSGAIRAGRLYGRGSWDMKGGLAAQFAVAAALRRAGVRLGGDLLCESVIDEEWAGGGGTLAGRLRGDNADAAVIAEGTNLATLRATRGGHFFEIECAAGDSKAYFSKQEAVSPAVPMGRLLGWIDQWTQRRRLVPVSGPYRGFADPTPVQVLAMEANRFDPCMPWSVPLAGRVRVYFQFLPSEDVIGAVGRIKESFKSFCRRDPFFKAYPPIWRDIVWPPLLGHELPAADPWTKCLVASATAAINQPPAISAAPYPCDAFLLQREFGIPTLLFGPCGAGAHNIDEHVTIRSVIQTAQTLLTAALVWCGGKATL
ncbi:MAG: M20/M25/M40 family metallo-hydrolase [Phycisphaerae bacterium]